MPAIQVSEPQTEPLSLAEARVALRIDEDDTSQDALIPMMVKAVREMAEGELRRPLITRDFELVIDRFTEAIKVPAARAAIAWIKFLDENEVEQTLDPSDWRVDNADEIGPTWITLKTGRSWPRTADLVNAVRVRFSAGYGTDAAQVPASIRTWMIMHLRAVEGGSAISEKQIRTLPFLADSIQPFVVYAD